MKVPNPKHHLGRPIHFRRGVALILVALGLGVASGHAETFKFESATSLYSYRATIGGELSFPPGRGPFPVVILLHPCGGLDQWANASLSVHARSLAKVGFATYILDSFTARGLTADKICKGGGEAVEFRLDDLFNAREALRKHPKIDKDNFFAMGQSHGGGVALWAAINTANRERFRAVAAFYPDCRALRHGLTLKSPTIIFAGRNDDWTPSSDCEDARKRERPLGEEIELIIYPDAYHAFDQQRRMFKYLGHTLNYDRQATEDSGKRMQRFFVRYLTEVSPTASSAESHPK